MADPIIVSGGSVTVDLSDKFKEDKDTGAAGGRKKYKNPTARLLSLEVNGVKLRDLNPTDEVRIICDDEDVADAGAAPSSAAEADAPSSTEADPIIVSGG